MAIKYSTYDSSSGNNFALNNVTGISGVFTSQISGNVYKASGDVVVITGSGDVRPYGLFSFPTGVGSSGEVLSTQGNGLTAWIAGGSSGTINEYTGNSTWTKPSGCTFVYVEAWGAGGGGAGGALAGSGQAAVATGGGGGGGGSYNSRLFKAVELPSSVVVTIGAGGGGGSGTTGITATGVAGDGGNSSFGSYVIGYGGRGANGITGGNGAGQLTSFGAPYATATGTRIQGGGGISPPTGYFYSYETDNRHSYYGGGAGAGTTASTPGVFGEFIWRKRLGGNSVYGGAGGAGTARFSLGATSLSQTGLLTLRASGFFDAGAFCGSGNYINGIVAKGITFGDGIFVVWSDFSSSFVLASTDSSGTTWTVKKTNIGGVDGGFQQIIYDADKWLAILAQPVVYGEVDTPLTSSGIDNNYGNKIILSSTDLESWQVTGVIPASLDLATNTNSSRKLLRIVGDGSGNYLAGVASGSVLGGALQHLYQSSGLSNWTIVTGRPTGFVDDILYDSGTARWVIAGSDRLIAFSTDNGTTWTSGTISTGVVAGSAVTGATARFGSIAANGSGVFVAKAPNINPGAIYSLDSGVNWSGVGTLMAWRLSGDTVYSRVSGFFITSSGNNIYRSTDSGATWTSATITNVAIRGRGFAVNDSGTVFAVNHTPSGNTGASGDPVTTFVYTTTTPMTSTWTGRSFTIVSGEGGAGETPTGYANGGGGGGISPSGLTAPSGGNGAPGFVRVFAW